MTRESIIHGRVSRPVDPVCSQERVENHGIGGRPLPREVIDLLAARGDPGWPEEDIPEGVEGPSPTEAETGKRPEVTVGSLRQRLFDLPPESEADQARRSGLVSGLGEPKAGVTGVYAQDDDEL